MPWQTDNADPDETFRSLLPESDAVVLRIQSIREEDFEIAHRLRVVAKHGVGLDNIDCAAATRRGLPVVYTPGSNTNAVAEHTLALLLGSAKHLAAADLATRQGEFRRRGDFNGVEIAGKTLGIIGLGRIGSRVALKAAGGLGMDVLAYDPLLDKTAYSGPARFVDSLKELMTRADFLTLHVPLTDETRGMISADSLQWVQPSCRLINTSRGAVIDEAALVAALENKRLAGAALDVFEQEPLAADHPLCSVRNMLLSPHMAALTAEAFKHTSIQVAKGVLAVLRGESWPDIANPEVFDREDGSQSPLH